MSTRSAKSLACFAALAAGMFVFGVDAAEARGRGGIGGGGFSNAPTGNVSARQTPKTDFGDRMKAGLDTAAGILSRGRWVH